jgi:hypothetical protein
LGKTEPSPVQRMPEMSMAIHVSIVCVVLRVIATRK